MNNKNRLLTILLLIFLVFSLSGCIKKSNNVNQESSSTAYELYAYNENGIVQYVQIQAIDKSHISYSTPKDINFRKLGFLLGDICETAQNKIYCSTYRKDNGDVLGNSIYVLSNGKIEKSIVLKTSLGPNMMLSDIDKNKVYVMMAVQPASYNPKGNVIDIIDTQKDEYLRPFYLKGGFGGYDFKNNLIYTTAFPKGLGFTDIPDSYIATINRDTFGVNVLINQGVDNSAIDLKIAPNGKIYTLNTPSGENKNDYYHGGKVNIYKPDGRLQFRCGLKKSALKKVLGCVQKCV